MSKIEARLEELEKKARINRERWEEMAGDIKGVALALDCIGAALATHPSAMREIITSLETVENVARSQNEHETTIKRLRACREFFEERLKKS